MANRNAQEVTPVKNDGENEILTGVGIDGDGDVSNGSAKGKRELNPNLEAIRTSLHKDIVKRLTATMNKTHLERSVLVEMAIRSLYASNPSTDVLTNLFNEVMEARGVNSTELSL